MRIFVLAVLVAVAGCAVQPEENPGATATAPTPPIAQVAATEPTAVAPAEAASGEEPSQFQPPAGYKLRSDKGADVYCTKIVVLGSRFPKEDCRTVAQLRDLERQKESMRGEMDQKKHMCTSAGGCANN